MARAQLDQLDSHGFFGSVLPRNEAFLERLKVILPPPKHRGTVEIVRHEDGTDFVVVSYEEAFGPERIVALVASALENFPRLQRFAGAERVLGPELAEFYRQREIGIAKLEALSQRLIEQNEVYRRKLDEEQQVARKELSSEYERKLQLLHDEHQVRDSAVREKEAAVDRLQKQLDDRSSRHARRDSRRDFKTAIAARGEKFSLSSLTSRKRWLVHGIFVVLLILLGSVALQGLFWPRAVEGLPTWFPALRASLAVVGFAVTAAFYIRWNDAWFRQHADEEFRLKRFDLDIDRAHYVVEMLLEWNEEKGNEIPSELIRRLTANLFAMDESVAARHPYEDLASALLGASAGLRLALPGGIEAQLTKGGIRKFQKEASRAPQQERD